MNVSNEVQAQESFQIVGSDDLRVDGVAMILTRVPPELCSSRPTGDGREIVVKALRGIRNIKSYRIRWEYSIAGRVPHFLMSVTQASPTRSSPTGRIFFHSGGVL